MPCEGQVRSVLDVGSNSVLTLVCAYRMGTWETIFESSAVTALGEGTKTTGLLSQAAIERTLGALREGFAAARRLGASQIVACATMAARIAGNTEHFLELAAGQGTPVRVLSGEDEAHYGYQSVVQDAAFGASERITIIDVGGHSTEIVASHQEGTQRVVDLRKSYPIGTLALRSGVLSEPSPSTADRLKSVQEIDEAIGLCFLPNKAGKTVALGATATNLITIREGMTEWEPLKVHGQYLLYEEVGRAAGWLFDLDDDQRAAVVGMEPGRERSLHIGVLILERFLFATRSETCWVSTRGWRHALLETLEEA